MSTTAELTRRELYDRVWTTPMVRLAAELGISDVGLAKICKRHNIPRPNRGYWAKLHNGKRVRKIPLPKVEVAERRIAIPATPQPPKSDFSPPEVDDPEIATILAKEREPSQAITIGERVRLNHPIVIATRESLQGQKADEFGRVSAKYEFSKPHFRVDVSPKNVPRVLRILQVLTSAFIARGFHLKKSETSEKKAHFDVLGELVSLSIWEPSKRIKRPEVKSRSQNWLYRRPYDHCPTGKVELSVNLGRYYSAATIRDTVKRPLESRLNEVVIVILKRVDQIRTQARLAQIEAQEKAERKRIAIEQEIERRSDSVRIAAFQQLARDLTTYEQLAATFDKVRTIAESKDISVDPDTERWLEWASDYLRRIDPTSGGENLPVFSLSESQRAKLRKECEASWSDYSETFRNR